MCDLWGRLYTYRKIRKNDREMWKTKSIWLCILPPFFHFSHFASGSAFVQKVKGFRSLFFRCINKTWNSHTIWKVYSVSYSMVCFAKCSQNAKYEKCIAGLRSQGWSGLLSLHPFYILKYPSSDVQFFYSDFCFKSDFFFEKMLCILLKLKILRSAINSTAICFGT